MEICELCLSLPASFFFNSAASMPDARPRLLPSQSFPLSLYRVNATLPLDISTISYETRPPRVAKVGDVQFAPGTQSSTFWHRKFTCAEEEILTFELACSEATISANEGEACRIEWWQNKDHSDPGMSFLCVFAVEYFTDADEIDYNCIDSHLHNAICDEVMSTEMSTVLVSLLLI